MKKKSIISVLLIIAMAFSLTALTACGGEDEVEEEITVNVKIVGAGGDVLSDREVKLFDVPSNLTVYAAVAWACDIDELELSYDYDFHLINQIGIYGTPEEADSTRPTTIDEDGEIEYVEDDSYWYWGFKVNGTEGRGARETKITNGNTILVEWLKEAG